MWEACWAHYQTDYFHLFLCVAIIAVYGEDVVQQDLPADEMLLHFSSLSMHMSGEVVLRKVLLFAKWVVVVLDSTLKPGHAGYNNEPLICGPSKICWIMYCGLFTHLNY